MGIPLGGTIDAANVVVTGTITATALVSQAVAASTGTSAATGFYAAFNLALSGTFTGTVLLEKSFDAGSTWITVAQDVGGTAASYVLAWTTNSINLVLYEIEKGVLWRLRCTAFTSGTLTYRFSQGSDLVFVGALAR